MNNDTNTITFQPELVKRLNNTFADAHAAVAEAACAAFAQDAKVTVRAFATALRNAAPALGTNNAVLSAAVKAAKTGATAVDVAEAMASAIAAKRTDDARRAAAKRAAAPGKALEKAQAEVDACKLAMRTPVEVARDNLAQAEAAVRAAADALAQAEAARSAAADALAQAAAAAAAQAA